jgi:hypothetical protein
MLLILCGLHLSLLFAESSSRPDGISARSTVASWCQYYRMVQNWKQRLNAPDAVQHATDLGIEETTILLNVVTTDQCVT